MEIFRNAEVPGVERADGSSARGLVVAPPTVSGCLVATNVKLIRRLRVRGDAKKKQYFIREFDFREYWWWLARIVEEPLRRGGSSRAFMVGLEKGLCVMFLLLPRPESFRTIDCKSRGLEGEALDKIYVFPLLSPADVR